MPSDHSPRHGDHLLDVLLREDGQTGGDTADERQGHDLLTLRQHAAVGDLQDAHAIAVALDVAFALKRVQVLMHRRGGAQAEGPPDLPDRRDIAGPADGQGKMLQDLALSRCEKWGHRVPPGALIPNIRSKLKPHIAGLTYGRLFLALPKALNFAFSPVFEAERPASSPRSASAGPAVGRR